MKQGTRPSKKDTKIKDVKRYLNVASIAKDGLTWVVKRILPLQPVLECIIVPRDIISGLLTAMHLTLEHHTAHQLKQIVRRQFYALDMDHYIDTVTAKCHQCVSLRKPSHPVVEQTTSDPPDSVGLAADVIKREKQLILVVRESVTSYTVACLVESEHKDCLLNALVRLCIDLRPLDGPRTVIRTDNAPGFRSLVSNELLDRLRLSIELGRPKNVNKNPVAERAIQELEDELLRQDPSTHAVTPLMISLAFARLNSRIRHSGLSSREMWYRRNQFSNKPIDIDDQQLIDIKQETRTANHPHSERAKGGTPIVQSGVSVGDIVYLFFLAWFYGTQ